jgi:hypothetical protein
MVVLHVTAQCPGISPDSSAPIQLCRVIQRVKLMTVDDNTTDLSICEHCLPSAIRVPKGSLPEHSGLAWKHHIACHAPRFPSTIHVSAFWNIAGISDSQTTCNPRSHPDIHDVPSIIVSILTLLRSICGLWAGALWDLLRIAMLFPVCNCRRHRGRGTFSLARAGLR